MSKLSKIKNENGQFLNTTLNTVGQIGELTGNRDTVSSPIKHDYKYNKFCITVNNYTNVHIVQLSEFMTKYCFKYIAAKEVGLDKQTPHIQGAFILLNNQRCRYSQLFKMLGFTCHLEGMKGKWEKNIEYCSKENNVFICSEDIVYKKSIPIKPLKIIDTLYPWQQNVIDIIESTPDNRSIYWFFDSKGCSGKSELVKYILKTYHNVSVFNKGNANDISYQILNTNYDPHLCIFDLSRTIYKTVSYTAIEEIKNGLINSSKYEGGFKMFSSPHIFIFANILPDTSKLSIDRWKIFEIINNELTAEIDPTNIHPDLVFESI